MTLQPFDVDAFWDGVAADSAARRAAPRAFAIDALESIFVDTISDEEALGNWRQKVEQFPWWAADALYCIDAVLEGDDPSLEEIAAQARLPLGGQPVRQWLGGRRDTLHAVYDEARRAEPAA